LALAVLVAGGEGSSQSGYLASAALAFLGFGALLGLKQEMVETICNQTKSR
jgi:hypothetical protein